MNKLAQQRHRVNRVINFVRDSVAEPLTLDQMADIACLSRFHFTRVFSAHCGETPVEFLTRLRLEKSVLDLVSNPNLPITNIALDAGYSGSQAFSHAFRRRYGVNPRRFRGSNRGCVIDFPMNQWGQYPALGATPLDPVLERGSAAGSNARSAWPVSVRSFPTTRLAYIRHIGPYFGAPVSTGSANGIASTIEDLIRWAKARGVWHKHASVLGICPNNPCVTPPRYCQYDIGIAVDETISEDECVSIQEIPAMTLAVLEMTGGSKALMQAWRWLVSHWVPRNAFRAAHHLPFEIYNSDGSHALCPEHGITLCQPIVNHVSNDPNRPLKIAL